MVEGSVKRLCWFSLVCAVVIIFSLLLERSLQPEIAGSLDSPAVFLTWVSVILLALSINALRKFRRLSPQRIVNLGLLLDVAVAFAISFAETALPLPQDSPVLGVSKLAIWIALVGLLIPYKPHIRLAVAFVSATMWPLAYFINLHLSGYDPLPVNRLLVWLYPSFLMVFVTYGISKRIYAMETDAQKAHELGSYNLISLIGSGGMGEVWRGRHRMLARDAAIKLIRSELMIGRPEYQSEIAQKRFEREAQAIASLQSPHTVYLFDFGVSQDGSFYYVMELLDGISLQMLVDRFGPQPAARVVYFLKQVCDSLAEAHRKGLIHRDIKPSNIFTCSVGINYDFVKVLDFGLVKNMSANETGRLTNDGIAVGTPAYMAPEIALGNEDIDGRADIYALGCVAYFLLTGVPVFEEKTATATALAHVQKEPVPPSQRSEIKTPEQLEQIILRCISKRPEERPGSIEELIELLQACSSCEWDQQKAVDWWESNLPPNCEFRKSRRAHFSSSLDSGTKNERRSQAVAE
jgi:serine/threonine-protein kinase